MKRKILSILLALVLVLSFSLVTAVPVGAQDTLYVSKWTEYAENPIFGQGVEGPKAYYQSVIYDIDEFSGHGIAAKYKMWYGTEGSQTGLATSNDGIIWTDLGMVMTDGYHATVEYYSDGFNGANSGDDSSADTMYYRMWYWDVDTLYDVAAIGYSESPNGVNWYNYQPLQNGTVPIISGVHPEWNRGSYGPSDVLYNPDASNTGTDWVFTMYYDGTTGGDESIGIGFSSDGITWTGYDSGEDGKADPVLVGSVSGWDGGDFGYVSRCTVIKGDDGTYRMWFSGGTREMNAGIGYATSLDGINWTKDANNPILHKTDGVAWRDDRTYCPMVIEDGGIYKMWFTGVGSAYSIGYATNTNVDPDYTTIQAAIDDPTTDDGDTINVAAGNYAGAIVNKGVKIIGAAGGASVITSGPHYGGDHPTPHTAFLLDAGADGAEIKNFTINCAAENFWFGVYARSANSVIVDFLTINDTVQGITNWGGSNWEITNNVITETYPTTGGGIAIYLGADPGDFPHCDNNLVQYNTMTTNRAQSSTFTGAAIALFFDERVGYGGYVPPSGESMTGNEIKDNSITASGLENQTGIEIGVGGLEGDETKVAACLGVIHGNTVTNNTIDNAEWGLYLYVTTNLTVQGNTVKNCSDCGIYMKDDHANCLINYNDIYGNTNYGLNNTDGATYERTVDATKNWWGGIGGPGGEGLGKGDSVSANVLYDPWLTEDYATTIDDGIAYFGSTISLEPGWNTLSVPLKLKDSANTIAEIMDLGDFLTSENVEIVYQYNSGFDTIWENIGASDTELVPLLGYYIKILGTDTVDFPVLYSGQLGLPTLKLSVGWNLIGSAFGIDKNDYGIAATTDDVDGQKDVATALYSIKDKCSVVVSPSTQGQVAAWGTTVIDSDKVMIVGEAYWVFMTAPAPTLAGFEVTPIYYLP